MTSSRCPACGEYALEERIEPFKVEHDGQSRTIQDRRTICQHCGNVSYVGEQNSEHELAVAAVIREIEGLLSAAELQGIRLKYKFKQTDMEQILSTGPKTWTRWERGKVPQNKAADKLIRLIGDDPDIARRLMEQAGVENAEAAAVFAQIETDARSLGRALLRAELRALQDQDPGLIADQLADKVLDTARDLRRRVSNKAAAA